MSSSSSSSSSLPPSWAKTPSGLRRARDLGVPFVGVPGTHNAITDVAGVEVGYRTLIRGDGPLVIGQGPVRTGVTAIHPRGRAHIGVPVMAGVHSLNGNGEMTGWSWVEECGRTELPILLSNTHAIGVAHDSVIRWMQEQRPTTAPLWCLPVVAETFDGMLNDINGFHVTRDDVVAALETAHGGAIDEGSVGGGTGMVCYEWKGGSGTSSRKVTVGAGPGFEGHVGHAGTVGVFVQANFGRRALLTIAGAPIGRWLVEQDERRAASAARETPEQGSIIVVVATDLPLLPHQLKRLARRAGLGVGRSGGIAGHGSGDLFLAFSTGNASFFDPGGAPRALEAVPDDALSPVFTAVVQATDEAILNALVANNDMVGRDGKCVPALPHDVVERWMRHMARGPDAG
jgi:L-aminopeptidase/D-esterase-like protein